MESLPYLFSTSKALHIEIVSLLNCSAGLFIETFCLLNTSADLFIEIFTSSILPSVGKTLLRHQGEIGTMSTNALISILKYPEPFYNPSRSAY
ncbi:MAG: hypothetical protein GY757_29570 [bacterium]|nr:hypothetical protein [bacterium]